MVAGAALLNFMFSNSKAGADEIMFLPKDIPGELKR